MTGALDPARPTPRGTTKERAIDTTGLQDLRRSVVDRMPELLTEIAEALREDWPDHARFLLDNDAEVTASAVAVVDQLLTLTDGATDGWDEPGGTVEQSLFEEIGRLQWRDGKDLTQLLSAYRTGVRVFWEHASAVALEVGVEPGTLAALAHAVFLFVDRLSSSSARGYVLEQGEAGAEREHHRDELVALLLSDRADRASVRAAALRAGWTVPEEATVVLVLPDDPAGQHLVARLGPSALPIRHPEAGGGGLRGAILPYPGGAGAATAMRRVLQGVDATVGPAVAPHDLPASLRLADIAARLRADGLLGTGAGGPLLAAEHLDTIIVHRDEHLLDTLRHDVLHPLQSSPSGSRARLRETLRTWLLTMGDRQAMAATLHVHPQTVRYRLARLQELFGPALDDPATRAQLTLALCWDPADHAGAG